MLKGISWKEYAVALIILGAVYYIIILLLYYRKDILNFLRGKKDARAPVTSHSAEKEADDAFAQASAFKKEINELLQEAKEKAWIKQELLMAFAGRAQSFPAIKGTPFQSAIEYHILQQTPLITQVILDPEDVRRIW